MLLLGQQRVGRAIGMAWNMTRLGRLDWKNLDLLYFIVIQSNKLLKLLVLEF